MRKDTLLATLSALGFAGVAFIAVAAGATAKPRPSNLGVSRVNQVGTTTGTYSLTLEGARLAGEAAASYAHRHAAGGAIAVVDSGGALLYLVRLDNTFPAAAEVSIAKARTAAMFRRPTQAFEHAIRDGRVSLTAVAPMTPLEGGVPLVVDGQVVGAIGCSGALSSAQDVEVAQAGVAALGG